MERLCPPGANTFPCVCSTYLCCFQSLYQAHKRILCLFTRPSWNLVALLCEASVTASGKLWFNSENILYMRICVGVPPTHVCICACHMPARDNLKCHSLGAIHSFFSDKAPHWDLGLRDKATLATQWASGIFLSPSSQGWDYKCARHLAFYCTMGIIFGSLKALYQLSHVPSPWWRLFKTLEI